MRSWQIRLFVLAIFFQVGAICGYSNENWLQYKYDCRHSGNVPERSVTSPLGLIGAMLLTDAIFTSPVVADGQVYAVDGSGVAFRLDAATLNMQWDFPSKGGKRNCNNVSSPAVANG